MSKKKKILVFIGSTKQNSSSYKLINKIEELIKDTYEINIYKNLAKIPHFDPNIDDEIKTPIEVIKLRKLIKDSDAIIICTPEYIYSVPSILKNVFEWCVSSTVFLNKPTGIIVASLSGEKCFEELKLITKTVNANFSDNASLLINGIKSKFDNTGELVDSETTSKLNKFLIAFDKQIN